MVTVTVAFASAVPVRVGVVLLLSAALVTVGASGRVVSMVSVWVPAEEMLPAASVAVAETGLAPLALRLSVPEVGVAVARLRLQVPLVAVVV
ncbi:hypothetical protein ABAZ39_20950 (plasmid) [Azospirillum argentinense]|uniref:Uncharacterized protein n=1 Tax=Azospirillum argentinense TaxID=2970906 RepID=A0A060DNF3_9PROT|nr:hypothetical protein ABAZ39_20950 [Azospirillum argentinense]